VSFELLLFSTQPDFIRRAGDAGIDGFIVDWEVIDKLERQAGADTQINRDTLEDLERVRSCTSARVICRINSFGPTTSLEIHQAIQAGADEILLPMVRLLSEVNHVLDLVGDRCKVGILLETLAGARIAHELAQLPLSRVYVGLNDLGIERKTANIFTAVADGTVESLRNYFNLPFGFGGLTLPERGYPIPCRLLMGEMARLNCQFSFLRRSFLADIQGRDLSVEVPRIRAGLEAAYRRSPQEVRHDQAELQQTIKGWLPVRS